MKLAATTNSSSSSSSSSASKLSSSHLITNVKFHPLMPSPPGFILEKILFVCCRNHFNFFFSFLVFFKKDQLKKQILNSSTNDKESRQAVEKLLPELEERQNSKLIEVCFVRCCMYIFFLYLFCDVCLIIKP